MLSKSEPQVPYIGVISCSFYVLCETISEPMQITVPTGAVDGLR